MSTNTPLLDAFVAVAPYIKELLWFDVAVAVVDGETKKVAQITQGSTIQFPVKVGDPTPEQTIAMEVIRTGKRVVRKASGEAFGFPYLSIGIPIFEDGKITGSVSFNTSMEMQRDILEMAKELDQVVKAVDEKSKKMSERSLELNETGQHLSSLAFALKAGMETATRQSNLLGLDASIAAARSGEGSAGQETSHQSESRAEFLKQVEEIKALVQKSQQDISNQLVNIITAILSVDDVASSQTALAAEIQESMRTVRDKSESLLFFAEKIMA